MSVEERMLRIVNEQKYSSIVEYSRSVQYCCNVLYLVHWKLDNKQEKNDEMQSSLTHKSFVYGKMDARNMEYGKLFLCCDKCQQFFQTTLDNFQENTMAFVLFVELDMVTSL